MHTHSIYFTTHELDTSYHTDIQYKQNIPRSFQNLEKYENIDEITDLFQKTQQDLSQKTQEEMLDSFEELNPLLERVVNCPYMPEVDVIKAKFMWAHLHYIKKDKSSDLRNIVIDTFFEEVRESPHATPKDRLMAGFYQVNLWLEDRAKFFSRAEVLDMLNEFKNDCKMIEEEISPEIRIKAEYYRGLLQMEDKTNHIDSTDTFRIFHNIARNEDAPMKIRMASTLNCAFLRLTDRIDDRELTNIEAFNSLQQVIQNKYSTEHDKIMARYFKARMRINKLIGEDLLSINCAYNILMYIVQKNFKNISKDMYRTLNEVYCNAEASESDKNYAKYLLVQMRIRRLINDDKMDTSKAFLLCKELDKSEEFPTHLRLHVQAIAGHLESLAHKN